MEFVFVVPRTALFPDCYPHGLVRFGEGSCAAAARPRQSAEPGTGMKLAELEAAVARDGFFVERAYAERTPSLKQVIPYSIIVCDGRVLLFQRLATGGEQRLHGKLSIGIGGHINPEDLDGAQGSARAPIAAGTQREIREELDVRGTFEVRCVGLLNDDSNPVGAVHVGVVQVVYVSGSVEIREREQLEGRLVTCEELSSLLADGANFETWSRLLVPRLDELLNLPLAAHP
jgi:predicted NUDIX family phosphoesterase